MRQNAFVYKRHIPCEHIDQDGPFLGTYVTFYDQWDHPAVFSNSTYNHLFPIPCLSQKPTNIHWDSQHTSFCDRLHKTWGSCHSNYWILRVHGNIFATFPDSFPDHSMREGCSSLLPECSGYSPLWLLQQQPAPQTCAPWRGSPRQHANPPTLIKTLITLMRRNSERGKLANSY